MSHQPLVRGGSLYAHPRKCRTAYRGSNPCGLRLNNVGFRPVITKRSIMSSTPITLCGGSWYSQPLVCRVFFRGWGFASLSTDFVGFRPIVTLHELLNRHD